MRNNARAMKLENGGVAVQGVGRAQNALPNPHRILINSGTPTATGDRLTPAPKVMHSIFLQPKDFQTHIYEPLQPTQNARRRQQVTPQQTRNIPNVFVVGKE